MVLIAESKVLFVRLEAESVAVTVVCVIKKTLRRSKGAVQVRDTAPAHPPAARYLKALRAASSVGGITTSASCVNCVDV